MKAFQVVFKNQNLIFVKAHTILEVVKYFSDHEDYYGELLSVTLTDKLVDLENLRDHRP